MKKNKKIAMSIIIIFIILATNRCLAMSFGDIKNQGDNWLQQGSSGDTPITTGEALSVLAPIGQVLVGIGTIVLVIMYMYLGIKYMMTDPSGKADIKQKLIGLVIATVLIYGGVGIFTIIINLFNSILA